MMSRSGNGQIFPAKVPPLRNMGGALGLGHGGRRGNPFASCKRKLMLQFDLDGDFTS